MPHKMSTPTNMCTASYNHSRDGMPYPWREHGKVEEHGTSLCVQGEFGKLLDGTERGKGFVDSNSQEEWTPLKLGFNVVCLSVT